MNFREINLEDIPVIFDIRVSTDENQFTFEELAERGITYESVAEKLQTTYKGWLCEINKKTVGFVIGDSETGEIWVIAVHPLYINKQIGTKLLQLSEDWLISKGNKKLWLITDPDKNLRAYSFYLKNGWKENKIEDGILYMDKEIK